MTTYFDFVPSPVQAFQFEPEFDGQIYTAVVRWSLFGARWYLGLFNSDGGLVFNLPLVGSTDALQVNAVEWAHGYVTLRLAQPHNYPRLATIDLTLTGFLPVTYNQRVRAFVNSPETLQYPSATDPGTVTTLGVVDNPINLVGGYFTESTLVFREANQQFEVSP